MLLQSLLLTVVFTTSASSKSSTKSSVDFPSPPTPPPPPIINVGAIRWDCWCNESTSIQDPCRAIENAISLPEFADRVPWFCTRDPITQNVTCNDNVQSVMDTEIEQAVSAGLTYWAFDQYPLTSPLTTPRLLYLNSTTPGRSKLKWSYVLQTGWITQGGLAAWVNLSASLAADFARDDFLHVRDGSSNNSHSNRGTTTDTSSSSSSSGPLLRPLIYLFSVYENAWGPDTTWSTWQLALEMLANASLLAGTGKPYIALQTFDVSQGQAQMESINAGLSRDNWLIDALSSYAVVGGATFPQGGMWQMLMEANLRFWNDVASLTPPPSTTTTTTTTPATEEREGRGEGEGEGKASSSSPVMRYIDVVPPVTISWDPRPMNFSYLPWANYTDPRWVQQPTLPELQQFVQQSLNFTLAAYQAGGNYYFANPTGSILLSAWNEYAEGHWIAAVQEAYGGNARLEAIGEVLVGKFGEK